MVIIVSHHDVDLQRRRGRKSVPIFFLASWGELSRKTLTIAGLGDHEVLLQSTAV